MRTSRRPDKEEQRLVRHLTQARKTLKVTQRELAEHIGVSAQQLGKVERGENRLTLGRYVAALQFLKRAGPQNLALSMGFAEAEQAIFAYQDDATADLLEAVKSLRSSLDGIEAAVLRLITKA